MNLQNANWKTLEVCIPQEPCSVKMRSHYLGVAFWQLILHINKVGTYDTPFLQLANNPNRFGKFSELNFVTVPHHLDFSLQTYQVHPSFRRYVRKTNLLYMQKQSPSEI